MKSLHEEIRELRLEKGISLEDISKITKIRIHILEKIEEGDFSIVPAPYIRAFMMEIAKVIGIDPKIALEKYEEKGFTIDYASLSGEEKSPASAEPGTTETIFAEEVENAEGEKEDTGEKPGITADENQIFSSLKESSDTLDLPEETEEETTSGILETKEQEETLASDTQTEVLASEPSRYSSEPETSDFLTTKDKVQFSLFNADGKTTSEMVTDEISVNETEKELSSQKSEDRNQKKKYIKTVMEEPKSNKLFFIVFSILIIVAFLIMWISGIRSY